MNNVSTANTASMTTCDASKSDNCVEPSSEHLLSALRSCIPVLPVLTTQLQEVVHQVEEAVVGVCGSFQGIAARARQIAARVPLAKVVSESSPNAEAEGIDGLIANTRATMGSLLEHIEQASNFSNRSVQRMQTIEGQLGGLDTVLRGIDEIAAQARLLALNGQIEAARLGSQGSAFAIVATETAKMAIHAMSSSKTIRSTTETVSTSIDSTSTELRNRAAADTREAASRRDDVNRALDAMTALHEEMQRTIEQSKRESEQLARDISAAVMAMQFQDSVSQRIGHVIHTLEEMHSALQLQLGSNAAAVSPVSTGDWANRMAQRYTMASEHKVLAAHASQSTDCGHDPGNNVELF